MLCAKLLQLCLTLRPYKLAHQTLLFMGFSRQKYWSGLPFPSPGDLPDSRIEPGSPLFRNLMPLFHFLFASHVTVENSEAFITPEFFVFDMSCPLFCQIFVLGMLKFYNICINMCLFRMFCRAPREYFNLKNRVLSSLLKFLCSLRLKLYELNGDSLVLFL